MCPGSRRQLTMLLISQALLPLMLGLLLYVSCRSQELLLWRWSEALGIDTLLLVLREHTHPLAMILPRWTIDNLPAALWAQAFLVSLGALWLPHTRPSLGRPYLIAAATIILGSELAQLPGLLPGTFDLLDLLAYLAGLAMAAIALRVARSNLTTPNTTLQTTPANTSKR